MIQVSDHDPLTFTATDWAWRSHGGRMGRGRVTSQYAVREASAPRPSREDGDRDSEDRDKEDRGRDGRSLQKSSASAPLSPELERSDPNHSWKCIAERRGEGEERNNRISLQVTIDTSSNYNIASIYTITIPYINAEGGG